MDVKMLGLFTIMSLIFILDISEQVIYIFQSDANASSADLTK